MIILGCTGLGILFVDTVVFSRSPRRKLEHYLGVALPRSATDVRIWYYQAPGYYEAELLARFRIPRADFLQMMAKMKVNMADPTHSPKLPKVASTAGSTKWWTPPTDQPERFCQSGANVRTIYLWADGYVYVEKSGSFGSAWTFF